jgi:hypothetical protein
MKKAITVAAIIAAFVAPAFAAGEYYVVQDVKTKKCTIIDKKPTDESKAFVNAAGTVYRTRSEAEIGMKSVKGLQVGLKGLIGPCPAAAWFET